MSEWKQGLPKGKYYKGMENDFEVSYSPIGLKWHRRRTPKEKAEWISRKTKNDKEK